MPINLKKDTVILLILIRRFLKIIASWAGGGGGGDGYMEPKKCVMYFKVYHTSNRNIDIVDTGGRW